MFGFGKKGGGAEGAQGAASDADIFDVTDAEFMTKVVDASRTRPVIVDFWAPWCGPCKTLGPALEKAVAETKGKVALAKVDIDKNPQVANQLRVQSIPAVFAFVNGQGMPGFMGAVPPSEIKMFVEEVMRAAGVGADADVSEILDAADAALAEGAIAEAAQAYGAVFQQEPTETRAIAGLARVYAATGDLERARQTLSAAPKDKENDAAIAAARSAIDLAEQTAGAAQDLAKHSAAVEADPDNHQARLDLALALVAVGRKAEAVDQLLELFRRDREWSDGAAKAQLIKLFEAFGPTDPVTLAGRRKLSSMIFA